MKRNIKHVVHIAIFLILLTCILIKVTDILEGKKSEDRYGTFFCDDEKYDVFFLGTSHVITGVYPMELYNNYGITSYVLGNWSSPIPTTYHILLNALEYKTPKLVVIDLYKLNISEKVADNFNYVHSAFDEMPLTLSKVTSVNDLTDNLKDKMSLLLKLPNYHERWSDLSIKDFQNVNSYNKGSEVKIKVTPFTDSISNESVAPSDTALKYLEKAIQLCQSKGIDVLLTYIPYVEGKNYDNIETIAEKYSINYLNMFNTADIINYGTDFFDEHGHLNASGAYKMSSYLGKYIMENYNIQDRRNDKSYNKWKSDYEDYVKNNIYRLNHVNNVYSYIMLLTNQEFECKITLRNEITLNSYPLIYELINNIDGIIKCDDTYMGNNTVYSNLTDNSKAFSKEEVLNDINITVYRRGTEEIISHVDFDI